MEVQHLRQSKRTVLGLAVACTSTSVLAAAPYPAEIAFAFGVLSAVGSFFLALIAGGLKIAVLRRFRMDAAWFQYGPRQAWTESQSLVTGRLLRRAYAIVSWLSLAAFGLAVLLLAPRILGR
jgi:hypothetical protein